MCMVCASAIEGEPNNSAPSKDELMIFMLDFILGSCVGLKLLQIKRKVTYYFRSHKINGEFLRSPLIFRHDNMSITWILCYLALALVDY